ncbi:uncharacterized protein LOC111832059 isoform X2 [Capsella rubella]|uniref:uncharacterized protein LOC111832059 isoform X2 n=1 Tax=Capsella rubella TaxID=81985 RepID=UPI000CD51EA0|nr:uncharacterized protein LOC111832059 isoform X2 [Capsella rubella]
MRFRVLDSTNSWLEGTGDCGREREYSQGIDEIWEYPIQSSLKDLYPHDLSLVFGGLWGDLMAIHEGFWKVIMPAITQHINQGFEWLRKRKSYKLALAMSQSLLLRSGSNKKMVASVPKRKIKVPFFENAALIEGYSKAVIGHCVNPRRQDMKSLLLMLPRIWQLEQLSSELAHLRYTRPSYTLHSHRQAGRAIILVKL